MSLHHHHHENVTSTFQTFNTTDQSESEQDGLLPIMPAHMQHHGKLNFTFESISDAEYFEFKQNGLPVFIYLVVLCVLGLPGNIQVLLVYVLRYKTSPYKVFVLCLAAVDLIACAFCIPSVLYSIYHPYTVDSTAFCKILSALSFVTGSVSLLLLNIIAFERFRKICQPLKSQVTVKKAKILCIVTVAAVLIVVVTPILVFSGARKISTPYQNLTGYKCMFVEKYDHHSILKYYLPILFTIFAVVMFFCLMVYVKVYIKLHQNKFHYTKEQKNGIPIKNKVVERNVGEDCTSTSASYTDFSMASSDLTNIEKEKSVDTMFSTHKNISNMKGNRQNLKLAKGKKKTIVFGVVSLLSFLSFVPMWVGLFLHFKYKNFPSDYAAINIFLEWIFFLNNVVNPLVYGFMDNHFRQQLFQLYHNVKICNC